MAEEKLIIRVGDYAVTSEISHDPVRGTYVVTSTCGNHVQRNATSVVPGVSYTAEQLEYDLEEFRHRMAAQAAGKYHVSTLMPKAITPVSDDVKEVPLGPRFPKPSRPVENAKSTAT